MGTTSWGPTIHAMRRLALEIVDCLSSQTGYAARYGFL